MTMLDVDAVAAIEQVAFRQSAWPPELLQAELSGPGRWYFVAEVLGVGPVGVAQRYRVVGYGGIAIGDVGEVMTLGVDPSQRGRGIGRRLMAELLTTARGRGADQVFLEVRVDNEVAQRLYLSMGFEQIAVRRGYYQPENVDALVMRYRFAAQAPQSDDEK